MDLNEYYGDLSEEDIVFDVEDPNAVNLENDDYFEIDLGNPFETYDENKYTPKDGSWADEQNCTSLSLPYALFNKLAPAHDNLFFSPFSISMALSMLYSGAQGNSRKQLALAMGIRSGDKHEESISVSLNTILAMQSAFVNIHIANAIFPTHNKEFLQSYIESVKKYYKSDVLPMDYTGKPQASIKAINNWVEEQTNSKIIDLVSADSIKTETVNLLVNAIYFKGDWQHSFDPKYTSESTFYLNKSDSVTCSMMKQHGYFDYFSNGIFKTLAMDYKERSMSFMCFLPSGELELEELEKRLSGPMLKAILKGMEETEVRVSIPKFSSECTFDLKELLSELDITDIFDENLADLSGMDGTKELFIDDVLHKAFIDVNEAGSEAAAATAVCGDLDCGPMSFKVNRPFLFMLMEKQNSTILFMGKVTKP